MRARLAQARDRRRIFAVLELLSATNLPPPRRIDMLSEVLTDLLCEATSQRHFYGRSNASVVRTRHSGVARHRVHEQFRATPGGRHVERCRLAVVQPNARGRPLLSARPNRPLERLLAADGV